jgi:hypothetical protein
MFWSDACQAIPCRSQILLNSKFNHMKAQLQSNVGTIDGYFRLLLGIVILVSGILLSSWWGAIGLVFSLTAAFKNCPLYSLFGINTCEDGV